MNSGVKLLAKKCSPQRRRAALAVAALLCTAMAASSTDILTVTSTGTSTHQAPTRESHFRRLDGPPANHVYLLKTHKCASTTLQRIILMYGIRHSLSFALPADGSHQFWPQTFNLFNAKRTAAYPNFDIMAVHARHAPSAPRLMHNDTVFLSIVRDPAEHLQSLYEYYQISQCVNNASFEQFVRNLHRNQFIASATRFQCPFTVFSNMQMYDFGFEGLALLTADAARGNIESLDRTFHLVLVTELFDESLVLMGDLLNWSDADLVYLRANARPSSTPISNDTRELIYKWNWADKMLYDHFRSKLEREISRRRAYVRWRVDELASQRARWHSLCVKSVVSFRALLGGGSASAPAAAAAAARRPDVTAYELSDAGRRNDTCSLLVMPEPVLLKRLHQQWPGVTGGVKGALLAAQGRPFDLAARPAATG